MAYEGWDEPENLAVHQEFCCTSEWDDWFGDKPVRWVEVEISTDRADDPDADPLPGHDVRVTIDATQAIAIWNKKIAEYRAAYGSD